MKDPYAKEPTVDLNPQLHAQYLEAKNNAAQWDLIAKGIRDQLERQIREAGAHAGLIDGRKLVTFRPQDNYAERQLIKDYPELTQHYMVTVEKEVFDLESFLRVHSDIAEEYRVRAFRSVADL